MPSQGNKSNRSRIASLLLTAPDAGSTNRLIRYQASLGTDTDSRNYDYVLSHFQEAYLLKSKEQDFKETKHYLRDLKNPVNGKLASQGVKEYAKLLEAGQRFAEVNHPNFSWNVNFKRAYEEMIMEYQPRVPLTPLKYTCDQDILDAVPRMETHSGFTFIETGEKEKRDNLGPGIFESFRDFIKSTIVNYQKVPMSKWNLGRPILPAVRTQGCGNAFDSKGGFTHTFNHKTRLVSMIDLIQIILELMYARPLQDYLGTVDWYAGGKSFDGELSSIIMSRVGKYRHWVSLDYSSYDQTISDWLIKAAFEIVHAWFGFWNITDRVFEDCFVWPLITNSFIHKTFVFDGEIITSHKGVPSGSMFTQIIDSVVNRLMIKTYMNAKGIKDYDMVIMGDDNLVFFNEDIDIKDLSSYLKHNFGITCNPDKCRVGDRHDPPHFLSVDWRVEGRYREIHEVWFKMLYPERKRVYANNRTKPHEVLYAYYLAYPGSMWETYDISRLLNDYPYLKRKRLEDLDTDHLPGFLKYQLRYERAS